MPLGVVNEILERHLRAAAAGAAEQLREGSRTSDEHGKMITEMEEIGHGQRVFQVCVCMHDPSSPTRFPFQPLLSLTLPTLFFFPFCISMQSAPRATVRSSRPRSPSYASTRTIPPAWATTTPSA